ncbi:DUF2634 domain-containing protein [Caldalkalibacillus mannanilyticus]|uniref:DUF2634 domain-containing protein n=1 Tax=Caldalkalibacillus mannanilyticus TaxID=1418 RepID=UPI00046916F6|nr:DUF2634 domain-containing protein [Caldalkalibacillus mannanilyticus]
MIPESGYLKHAEIVETAQPSKTWNIDFQRKRVTGMIDELEAIKQAVHFILNTERFKYLIYSADYGCELTTLIGKNPLLVRSEVSRMLEEALHQDDRIEGVENVEVTVRGDHILLTFDVVSVLGRFSIEQEVS